MARLTHITIIKQHDLGEISIVDKIFLDTNALLNYADRLNELDKIYVSSISLEELEEIKTSSRKDEETKFLARKAVRYLSENEDKLEVVPLQDNHYGIVESVNLKPTKDNLIIACAVKENTYNDVVLVTGDSLSRIFAKNLFNLRVEQVFSNEEEYEYKGYKEFFLDSNNEEDEKWLAGIYEQPENNPCNLHINEYLIIRDKKKKKLIDKFRWNGKKLVGINDKTLNLNSSSLGKIKPLDVYQSLAIDCLKNNQMSVVKGKAGSGKSLLSLGYAMSMIDSGKYSQLIVFSNPINSRHSAKLGFLPGTRDEKLLDSSAGLMLGCKFGDKFELQRLIADNKLILLPFSDIRGYDTSGKNAIVYILEAQNLDIGLMKIAIQRTSDDCKLIIDGDYNTQTDMAAYEGRNNGMRRVSEVFRGRDFYGEIELNNIYRSNMAKVADLM